MGPTDLLMYGLIAVMIFMMMRSSKKRRQQAEELQNQLVPGSKVILMSGIVGHVVEVKDDTFIMDTAGSRLEVNRAAIRQVTAIVDSIEEPADSTLEQDPNFLPPVPVKKTTRKSAAKKAAADE
jgi:preprotein translocase subunit YajC